MPLSLDGAIAQELLKQRTAAPVSLLDLETSDGQRFYFSDAAGMYLPRITNGLSFDGADDFVSVPDNAVQRSQSFTYEIWWKAPTAAPATTKFIVAKGSGSNRTITIAHLTNGVVEFAVSRSDGGSTAFLSSGVAFTDGQWHHISCTKTFGANDTYRLYVDGELKATSSPGGSSWQGTDTLYLGNSTNGAHANAMAGELDDFRIWDFVRSQTEIQRDMGRELKGTERGLVALYRMNEGAGTTLDDATTTANDATIGGATWKEVTCPRYYEPLLMSAGPFRRTRDMATDAGDVVISNLPGNPIQRDVAKLLKDREFEGALAIYRWFHPTIGKTLIDFHGTITDQQPNDNQVTFRLKSIFDPNEQDGLEFVYSQRCQWRFKSTPCGYVGGLTTCNKSFSDCQARGRDASFSGILVAPPNTVSTPVANQGGGGGFSGGGGGDEWGRGVVPIRN